MTDAELKHCPFCDSDDIQSGGDDKVVGYWCNNCQAHGPNEYGNYTWNDRAPSPPAVTVDREAIADIIEKAQIKVVYGRAWVRDPEEVAEKIIATLTPAPAVTVKPLAFQTDHGENYRIFYADTPIGRFAYGTDNKGQSYWQDNTPMDQGKDVASELIAEKKAQEAYETAIMQTDIFKSLIVTPAPVAGWRDMESAPTTIDEPHLRGTWVYSSTSRWWEYHRGILNDQGDWVTVDDREPHPFNASDYSHWMPDLTAPGQPATEGGE